MKKILFVTHTFLPESYGGAEQQTLKIASALNKKNYKTLIFSPKIKKKTPNINKINNVNIIRLKLNKLPSLRGIAIFSFISWFIKTFYWSLFNIKNFDAIYVVHGRIHSIPFVLISKIFNKKLFIKIGRGGDIFDLNQIRKKKIIGKLVVRILIKNVTAWIANSDEIYKDLKSYRIQRSKIFKIYNGVKFSNKKKRYIPGKKKFLYFGRFDKEKNLIYLINSFSKLSKNLDFKFTMVGDGTEKDKIIKIIKLYKLQNKIFIKGKTLKLLKFFKENHFFISASNSEGMSNSLLESSSFGLPSISSRVSGAKDIISDYKTGFIFNLKDKKDLQKKLTIMIKMKKNRYSKMSTNIQKLISKRFTIEIIVNEHIKMFNKVFNTN